MFMPEHKIYSQEAHKQVELHGEPGSGKYNGSTRLITWLPTKGLKVGTKVGNMTVAIIYSAIQHRCPKCGRLCAKDVIACLCE